MIKNDGWMIDQSVMRAIEDRRAMTAKEMIEIQENGKDYLTCSSCEREWYVQTLYQLVIPKLRKLVRKTYDVNYEDWFCPICVNNGNICGLQIGVRIYYKNPENDYVLCLFSFYFYFILFH